MTVLYTQSDDIRNDYLELFQEHMETMCEKCDPIDNLCADGAEILDSMNYALSELETR